jgi:hypothetical protein
MKTKARNSGRARTPVVRVADLFDIVMDAPMLRDDKDGIFEVLRELTGESMLDICAADDVRTLYRCRTDVERALIERIPRVRTVLDNIFSLPEVVNAIVGSFETTTDEEDEEAYDSSEYEPEEDEDEAEKKPKPARVQADTWSCHGLGQALSETRMCIAAHAVSTAIMSVGVVVVVAAMWLDLKHEIRSLG